MTRIDDMQHLDGLTNEQLRVRIQSAELDRCEASTVIAACRGRLAGKLYGENDPQEHVPELGQPLDSSRQPTAVQLEALDTLGQVSHKLCFILGAITLDDSSQSVDNRVGLYYMLSEIHDQIEESIKHL